MKNKKAFSIPLSRAALRALPARGDSDFIFALPGSDKPFGGLGRLKKMLDDAINLLGDPLKPWVFHDVSRSFSTWISDQEGDFIAADLCLAHTPPLSRVGRIYNRSNMHAARRKVLEQWGVFLDPESAKSDAAPLRIVSSS
jgi:hypothetical protein